MSDYYYGCEGQKSKPGFKRQLDAVTHDAVIATVILM